MRTILVSSGEKVALEVTITDDKGSDLSTFTFAYGWGTIDTPPAAASWLTPTTTDTTTKGQAVLSFTVDNTATLGTFFLWAKVTDTNGGVDFVRVSNEEVAIV